jgi:hypothetical protein
VFTSSAAYGHLHARPQQCSLVWLHTVICMQDLSSVHWFCCIRSIACRTSALFTSSAVYGHFSTGCLSAGVDNSVSLTHKYTWRSTRWIGGWWVTPLATPAQSSHVGKGPVFSLGLSFMNICKRERGRKFGRLKWPQMFDFLLDVELRYLERQRDCFYRNIILPVLVRSCENWSLMLREEHRFRGSKIGRWGRYWGLRGRRYRKV